MLPLMLIWEPFVRFLSITATVVNYNPSCVIFARVGHRPVVMAVGMMHTEGRPLLHCSFRLSSYQSRLCSVSVLE